jgi:hypothetical protein
VVAAAAGELRVCCVCCCTQGRVNALENGVFEERTLVEIYWRALNWGREREVEFELLKRHILLLTEKRTQILLASLISFN